jgi:hypothetical protein
VECTPLDRRDRSWALAQQALPWVTGPALLWLLAMALLWVAGPALLWLAKQLDLTLSPLVQVLWRLA